MALKVLIIPDKFKGTLNAGGVAAALAKGWRQARPQDHLDLVPMSDGGDGFGEVLGGLLQARIQRLTTVDAAHQRCRTHWWWAAKDRTAVLESARVIGLAMLPPGRFHPFELDTFGLGAVMRTAAARGARRGVIGIGGSATNDGGFGMARALGWKFLDRGRQEIRQWTALEQLETILAPPSKGARCFAQLRVAVDVQNRLLGARGATRIYGPQKGLKPADFRGAERALQRLAEVARKTLGQDYAAVPGAGAAGGLGFGLMAFAGGKLVPGFELFERQARLRRRLRTADLVLTGEGALDRSTLMGKGVGEIAWRCRELGIRCIGVAGRIQRSSGLERMFDGLHALTDIVGLQQAQARTAWHLTRLSRQLAISIEANRTGR